MKRVTVRCSFTVVVELRDDYDEHFVVEENSCPGTGLVGAALTELMAAHEAASTCWACAAQGENEILSVEHVPGEPSWVGQ